jgi:hypothetical protein
MPPPLRALTRGRSRGRRSAGCGRQCAAREPRCTGWSRPWCPRLLSLDRSLRVGSRHGAEPLVSGYGGAGIDVAQPDRDDEERRDSNGRRRRTSMPTSFAMADSRTLCAAGSSRSGNEPRTNSQYISLGTRGTSEIGARDGPGGGGLGSFSTYPYKPSSRPCDR